MRRRSLARYQICTNKWNDDCDDSDDNDDNHGNKDKDDVNDYGDQDDDDDEMLAQVSVKKKLFRKLRKFSAKNIENMISLSRSIGG